MTVQAYIVLDAGQDTAAQALNTPDYQVQGQAIVNTLANNLGYGTLVGLYVIPARVLNDPNYGAWVPTLGSLPIHVLDSDTLFNPPPAI